MTEKSRLLRIADLYGHNDIMMIGLHESVLGREDEARRNVVRRLTDLHGRADTVITTTARGGPTSSIDPQPCTVS
jgi:hypothetical protein